MERRSRWAGPLIVAVVLLAGGATLVGLASPALAGRVNPTPSVRVPRAGQQLPARPAWVKLYLGSAKLVGARLNGRQISDDLKGRRHGRAAPCVGVPMALTRGVTCKLRASPSHGLRYGKNMLKARFRRHHKVRVRTVPFRVARHRPLAAAGRNTFGDPRQRIHLNGRPSLIPPTLRHRLAHSGKRAKLRYRWRLVDRPRGSHGKLTGAHTSRPTLELGRRGRYKVRLTVTAQNGRTGRDSVIVHSETQGGPPGLETDPAPAVPVNTMATSRDGSQLGIQVGTSFYAAQPKSYAQLVVLDRQTLDPVSGNLGDLANKSYTNCSDQDVTPCVAALKSDLVRLSSKQIAIVSSQPDFDLGVPPPVGLEAALAPIGVAQTAYSQSDPGSISAIGVPGTPVGQGDWHADSHGGAMSGYLVRDNKNNYAFVAQDRIPFSTHATGSSGGDHGTNVIRVGGQGSAVNNESRVQPDDGGFQVFVVDAQDPDRGGQDQYFRTADISDRSELIDNLEQMRQMLQKANSSPRPELVFITSLMDPSIKEYYIFHDGVDTGVNSEVARLVDEVQQLGGTRNGFYKAIDPGGFGLPKQSYTLVSLSNSGPGEGTESVTDGPGFTNNPLNTTPISGALARTGPNYEYAVQGTPRIGPEPPGRDPSLGASELAQVAFQPPTPWPDQDPNVFPDPAERARKQAAIAWIGRKVLNTDDIRGQYWTYPLRKDGSFNDTAWTSIANAIQGLNYPQDPSTAKPCPPLPQGVDFCPDDLAWAKQELAGAPGSSVVGGEIGWLIAANQYLDALAEPFQGTALTQWSDLSKTVSDISSRVNLAPQTQVTQINSTAVFDAVRNFADLLPHVGELAYAVNIVYDLVSDFTEVKVGNTNVPAADDFNSTAGKVGQDLVDRLNAAQDVLTRQLPNTIAADYGKLSVVGACATTILPDPSRCPFPLSDWQYSQQDQKDAGKALVNTTRLWAFSQLLPAKYSLFQLPDWWRTSVSDNQDFYSYVSCGGRCLPFAGLPANGQVAEPVYRNMPTYAHTLTDGPCGFKTCWSSSGDTWRIFALGHLDKSGDVWQMQLPASSVTDTLFNPVDPNNLTEGPLGADPETFFDQNFNPQPLTDYPYPGDDIGWCLHGHDPCGGQNPPCCSPITRAPSRSSHGDSVAATRETRASAQPPGREATSP
jgi:hypothetical protein